MQKVFRAEGVYFELDDYSFVIETHAGIIFSAQRDSDNIWRTSEDDAFPDFKTVWADIRSFIAEIASSLWSEDKYSSFFIAVDAIFSTN